MEKDLKTLRIICKIGKIVSQILFACFIIGIVGCALGGVITVITKDAILENLKNIQVDGLSDTDFSMKQIYAALFIGLVACVFGLILSRKGVKFYKSALEIDQPLDLELAEKLKKLGIANIVYPLVSSTVCTLIWSIANLNSATSANIEIDAATSLDYGIALIVISLVLRYATNKLAETSKQEEVDEELSK